MSGIPTTSEEHKNYTMLGRGPDSSRSFSAPNLSLLQLVRGRKYQRIEDIKRIATKKILDIIIMLPRNNALPYDELISEHAHLRLMLFDPDYYERSSVGSLINAGMAEAAGELVMVIWNGVHINFDATLIETIDRNILCHLPLIQNAKGTSIPSLFVPTPIRKGPRERFIEPLPLLPDEDIHSLLPYDYSGIYVKERFNRSGGFADDISHSYWQKLEFGYRAWLWGERLRYLPGFSLKYSEEKEAEESTPNEDYLRFYLRMIAVVYTGDRAILPLRQFWHYLRAGTRSIFGAWPRFIAERRWVRKYAYHYRSDAPQFVELWGEDI